MSRTLIYEYVPPPTYRGGDATAAVSLNVFETNAHGFY